MVTEISGVGLSSSVASEISAAAAQRIVGTIRSDGVGLTLPDVARERWVAPATTEVAGVYAQLRANQDELNKTASVVRDVSNTVEQANQLLDQIENNLGQIVKMYPPYPVDSPLRISLLNNISGLRKQIDELTFPPPEQVDAVSRLLDTKSEPTKPDAVTAVKERMWDLPVLDPNVASDAEVSKMFDQVRDTQSSLQVLQTGIWQDVVSFVKQAKTPEAQNEATGVRDQLADLGNRGIGSNARQLELAAESK
jgi:hypothetical protein